MKIQKLLLFMFHLFCALTTGLVMFIGIRQLPYDPQFLYGIELLYLPATAFLCVLPTLIFAWGATESPAKAIVRKAIHFILTLATVLFSVRFFFDIHYLLTPFIVAVLLFFLAFYIAGHIALALKAKRIADELNKKLKALQTEAN